MQTRLFTRFVGLGRVIRVGVCAMAIAGALTLGGCLAGRTSNTTTTGTVVSAETLDSIRAGVSTRDDVTVALGTPNSKSKLESGGEVWRYSSTRVKESRGYILFVFGGSDTDVKSTNVSIRFGQSGVVEKVWRDDEK